MFIKRTLSNQQVTKVLLYEAHSDDQRKSGSDIFHYNFLIVYMPFLEVEV